MRLRQVSLFVLLFGVIGLLIFAGHTWEEWNRKGKITASGGRYFFRRVELPVPNFRQSDPRWGKEPLGPSNDTLASAGCALTSAAMVLASYGIDTDPRRLNQFVTDHGGYSSRGWLSWEYAALLAPDRVQHVYEDLPSYHLIDSNLSCGNPVIVRVRYESGTTHFVVIAGKDGFDYLMQDPGRHAAKGITPLKVYERPIEALRFYRKLD